MVVQKEAVVKNAVGLIGANLFNIFVVRMSLMWAFTSIYCLEEGIAFIPTLIISVFTNFIIVRYIVTLPSRDTNVNFRK